MDGTSDAGLTLAQRIEEARQRLWRVVGEIEVCEAEIDSLKGRLREARRQADFLYERYNERLELLNELEAKAAQRWGGDDAG